MQSKQLNPYLRNGEGASGAAAGASAPTIGDGGASWRLKALRRAKSQAGEEGKSLNEIVSERWGSVNELAVGINERHAAHDMAHSHAARDRRRQGESESEGNHRHGDNARGDSKYLKDVRSARSRMRRPSEEDLSVACSWHRHAGTRSGGSGSDPRRRTPLPSLQTNKDKTGDSLVLAAFAPELNAFANDGSFMDQFGRGGGVGGDRAEPSKHGEDMRTSKGEEEGEGNMGPVELSQEEGPSVSERRTRMPPPPPRPTAGAAGDSSHTGATAHTVGTRGGGGNMSAAAALRARLSGAGRGPTKPSSSTTGITTVSDDKEPHGTVVHLPLIDASGRAAPGAFGRESAVAEEERLGRPVKRIERYDKESGEKRRYYADDDALDLATLVKRTKYEGAADIDANLAWNISRKSRFRESDLDVDAEYDNDAGLDFADGRRGPSKDARRRGSASEEVSKREKARQIREYTRYTSALDKCALCISSHARQKQLTLALGNYAYLALPARGRLVPGHCQIVPAEHVCSTREVDENTWTEIRNFKKCLLSMFAAQGMECVFYETVRRPGGGGPGSDARAPHTLVDCVPLDPAAAAKAPLYFRKAIDDATPDWSQHANKRFIDTSIKGLRGAVPLNFPYFHVEFGLGAGFVHVMDDPESFDPGLARGVLVGVLGLAEETMHQKKVKKESAALQAEWAKEFREQFGEFDWTKALQ